MYLAKVMNATTAQIFTHLNGKAWVADSMGYITKKVIRIVINIHNASKSILYLVSFFKSFARYD
jgi:hypothetical protein